MKKKKKCYICKEEGKISSNVKTTCVVCDGSCKSCNNEGKCLECNVVSQLISIDKKIVKFKDLNQWYSL